MKEVNYKYKEYAFLIAALKPSDNAIFEDSKNRKYELSLEQNVDTGKYFCIGNLRRR